MVKSLFCRSTHSPIRVFVTKTGDCFALDHRLLKYHLFLWICATNRRDKVSLCGLNFLMKPNENKRHSASPWERSEVMPEEPGNHNGLSRHERLAYPSEYSRWCPSHLCCASYILASAHTDEGGCGAAAVNPSGFPVSVIFYFWKSHWCSVLVIIYVYHPLYPDWLQQTV